MRIQGMRQLGRRRLTVVLGPAHSPPQNIPEGTFLIRLFGPALFDFSPRWGLLRSFFLIALDGSFGILLIFFSLGERPQHMHTRNRSFIGHYSNLRQMNGKERVCSEPLTSKQKGMVIFFRVLL